MNACFHFSSDTWDFVLGCFITVIWLRLILLGRNLWVILSIFSRSGLGLIHFICIVLLWCKREDRTRLVVRRWTNDALEIKLYGSNSRFCIQTDENMTRIIRVIQFHFYNYICGIFKFSYYKGVMLGLAAGFVPIFIFQMWVNALKHDVIRFFPAYAFRNTGVAWWNVGKYCLIGGKATMKKSWVNMSIPWISREIWSEFTGRLL